MRLCRFNQNRLGVIIGDEVADVTPALDALSGGGWPKPMADPLIANLEPLRARIGELLKGAQRMPLAAAGSENPLTQPPKIIGAPVNYLDHLAEATADKSTFFEHQLSRIQEVGLFLKSSTSMVSHREGVTLRHADRRTDHELELAVIIGRHADHVRREDAMSYVAGYMIGLDMTVRGKEERSFRKSVDSFSVLGPHLVTAEEIDRPGALDMSLMVNGELRQQANTRDLVMDIPALIEFATRFYALVPGDVIMTGTPAGVGPVQPGDVISAWIEGIGSMDVTVRAEEAWGDR